MALVEHTVQLGPYGRDESRLVWDKLEKGDEVAYISSRSYYGEDVSTFIVDRVTATLIIMTDGTRWYRKNGQQQGGSSWDALLHPLNDRVIPAKQQAEFRAFKRALEMHIKVKANGYQEMMTYGDAVDKVRASFQARITILEGKRRVAV